MLPKTHSEVKNITKKFSLEDLHFFFFFYFSGRKQWNITGISPKSKIAWFCKHTGHQNLAFKYIVGVVSVGTDV